MAHEVEGRRSPGSTPGVVPRVSPVARRQAKVFVPQSSGATRAEYVILCCVVVLIGAAAFVAFGELLLSDPVTATEPAKEVGQSQPHH